MVSKSGTYEIALYGWPVQTGFAFKDTFSGITHIPEREVFKAKLQIGDKELSLKTSPTDVNIVFNLELEKGDKPSLQSWLDDKDGNDLG